jgi:DNA-binding protein Fis
MRRMNIILLAEGYLECPLCKQQLLKRNELETTLDNLSMEECKKLILKRRLDLFNGNKSKASKSLGINRRVYYFL